MITNPTNAGSGNLSCAVTLVNADYPLKVAFRYVDDDNHLLFQAVNRGRAELWARQAGQWQRLAFSLDAYASGDRFEVRAVGTELRVLRNGEPIVSAADGRFRSAGVCGLLDLANPDAVSGFAVGSLDGPPPPVPVKLGPVPAYYPDDPKYFDAEIP